MNAPDTVPDRADASSNALTCDRFLNGRFSLLQPCSGLRAGMDALVLAAAAPVRPGERVFEAGIGTGAAALAILTRVAGCEVVGVEREGLHADLARRNAELNGVQDRLAVLTGDVADSRTEHLREAGWSVPFDHAIANPPFFEDGNHRAPEAPSQRAAHVATKGDLTLWIVRMSDLLRGGGSLTLIHRPACLVEILRSLDGRLGGVTILPLAPHDDAEATRVIVQAHKGSRSPLRLLPPLVLHTKDGSASPALNAITRDGAAIDLTRSPAHITLNGSGTGTHQ